MPVTIADAGRVELYAKVMSKLAHLQREAGRTRKRRGRFRKTRRNHGSGARKENWQSTQQQDLALENARRSKQSGGKGKNQVKLRKAGVEGKGGCFAFNKTRGVRKRRRVQASAHLCLLRRSALHRAVRGLQPLDRRRFTVSQALRRYTNARHAQLQRRARQPTNSNAGRPPWC